MIILKKKSHMFLLISSPNTPGLRNLQKKKDLMHLLSNVIEARNKYCGEHKIPTIPLLLKISPDLADQDKKDIADVINDKKVFTQFLLCNV